MEQASIVVEPQKVPWLWPWGANRNESGQLQLHQDASVVDIANRFGSPLYVLDLDAFAGRCETIATAMAEEFWAGYGFSGASVYYAGKAFLCTALGSAIRDAGMGIDTASLGELHCALNPGMGVDPAKIGLHGNNKSEAALRLAITAGIGRIIVDSLAEIELLQKLAAELATVAPVMVRLTTGVHAGGHEFIATAHEDQKFGLSLASGAAMRAVEKIKSSPNLKLIGLHSHIGSQIHDLEAFQVNAQRVMEFRGKVLQLGLAVPEVDLGGGLAISYTGEAAPAAIAYARSLAGAVKQACEAAGTDIPHISIEPGRWVVGPTCVSVYRVGTIKDVEYEEGRIRRYVSVDGGMSDNLRPILYDANYTAVLANRPTGEEWRESRIVGAHCESGDILIPSVALPEDLQRDEILVVPVTGAYGRAMASNYNWFTRPGVLGLSAQPLNEHSEQIAEETYATWIYRGETVADLLADDLLAQQD